MARFATNLANRQSQVGQRREALRAAYEAVTLCRELAGKNRGAFLPELALSLNNLAAMQREVGQRREALTTAEDAVARRRELAGKNREAFLPNLAMSLGAYGSIVAEDRPAEALQSFAEGIRLLTPQFAGLPQAHEPLMSALRQCYLQAAVHAGVEPNTELLGPVFAVFEQRCSNNLGAAPILAAVRTFPCGTASVVLAMELAGAAHGQALPPGGDQASCASRLM